MLNKNTLEKIMEEASSQTIVAATKYVGVDTIKELYDAGITDIGENRVKDFLEKYEVLHDLDIKWHFIGHLQSKKVKKVINKVDYLHSLDRISLAEEIQRYRFLPLKCFVEVNISDENSKYGLKPEEVVSFCQTMTKYDRINIIGLMGMAELTDDKEKIKSQFSKLLDLRDKIKQANLNFEVSALSMGMSNDYKIAIECQATHLRLGSILFRNEE